MAAFNPSALYAVPFTDCTFAPATMPARQAGPSQTTTLTVPSFSSVIPSEKRKPRAKLSNNLRPPLRSRINYHGPPTC